MISEKTHQKRQEVEHCRDWQDPPVEFVPYGIVQHYLIYGYFFVLEASLV